MCRLLESIQLNHGILHNISLHNERFNLSRKAIFGIDETLQLENLIQLPENISNGKYKCRIVYGRQIEQIEFTPYQIRSIASLKIIHEDSIHYPFKFENRENINQLYLMKEQCDDILIVRNGLITDTSYCNIVFFDGKNFITPTTPLLNGTKRKQLLLEGKITEDEIKRKDIHLFKKVFLINAMLDIEDNIEISTHKII
jgi:4-amino-4-deoxychorismate lyase